MKKICNYTFVLLTLFIGFIFLLDSCESTYVHKNRPVVCRRVLPTKVIVVRRYSQLHIPVHANIRIGF